MEKQWSKEDGVELAGLWRRVRQIAAEDGTAFTAEQQAAVENYADKAAAFLLQVAHAALALGIAKHGFSLYRTSNPKLVQLSVSPVTIGTSPLASGNFLVIFNTMFGRPELCLGFDDYVDDPRNVAEAIRANFNL